MPFSALDFGLLIAYVVPGVIALYGLCFVSPRLRELWRGTGVTPTIGGAVLVTLIALVSGRVLSIVRIALMDSTFGVASRLSIAVRHRIGARSCRSSQTTANSLTAVAERRSSWRSPASNVLINLPATRRLQCSWLPAVGSLR